MQGYLPHPTARASVWPFEGSKVLLPPPPCLMNFATAFSASPIPTSLRFPKCSRTSVSNFDKSIHLSHANPTSPKSISSTHNCISLRRPQLLCAATNGSPVATSELRTLFYSTPVDLACLIDRWILCLFIFWCLCELIAAERVAEVKRVTKETDVYVKINLDGNGISNCSTGIPFLDHMLDVRTQAQI